MERPLLYIKKYDFIIPKDATHLKFPENSGQPLKEGDIPNSVTHLNFGGRFDQPLKEGNIPNSVTHLIFPKYYKQPLKKGVIPNSVKYLKFGDYVREYIYDEVWPDSLQILFIPSSFEYDDILNMMIKKKFIYYKYNNDICSRNYLSACVNDVKVKIDDEYFDTLL